MHPLNAEAILLFSLRRCRNAPTAITGIYAAPHMAKVLGYYYE